MNVCVSVAKLLLAKYPEHEVYFNTDDVFAEKIKNACHLFKPVIMGEVKFPESREDSIKKFEESLFEVGLNRYLSNFKDISRIQQIYIMNQSAVEEVIDRIKPDVILLDQLFNVPYVQNKNLPWGMIMSNNPLYSQSSPKYPPAFSGLSTNVEKDGHLWQEYRNHLKKSDIFKEREKWFKDCDHQLEDDDWFVRGSEYLNFYTYPEYTKYWKNPNELPGKWFTGSHAILDEKFENCLKDENHKLIKHPGKELLKPEFLAKPGKLILFSMGTIITFHTKIMNILLEIIDSLPHKFIVR